MQLEVLMKFPVGRAHFFQPMIPTLMLPSHAIGTVVDAVRVRIKCDKMPLQVVSGCKIDIKIDKEVPSQVAIGSQVRGSILTKVVESLDYIELCCCSKLEFTITLILSTLMKK